MTASDVIAAARIEQVLADLLLAFPDRIVDLDRIGRPSIRLVPMVDQVIDGLLDLYRRDQPLTLAKLCERWPVRRFIAGLERMALRGWFIRNPDVQLRQLLAELDAVTPTGRA